MGEWDGRRLHFVGIAGAGMSGLAVVSAALGASVTGSDQAESSYLERVREAGIPVAIGHAPSNLPPDAEVVLSTAISEENPERVAGRARGLREVHRGELLGEVSTLRRCIAVTGTHGKSTTSAMLVRILREAGLDPSYLVGASLTETGTNAEWGAGEWIVVEADESDRSLLHLRPEIAVVTNLELDHHSTYSSRLDLDSTIREFLGGAERVVVGDAPDLVALAPSASVFALDSVSLDAEGSRFVWKTGIGGGSASRGVEVRLPVPGLHNALNAAAALSAAALAGVDPAVAAGALAGFRPAGRRFERVGETESGAVVYDDYAHHPTEVAATLAAARTLEPRRVVAVFQPHLYSRTAALWREFGVALAAADVSVVLDVYRAREDPADWPGISGRLVAAAAADAAGGRTVAWLPDRDAAEGFLRSTLRPGDLLVTLGAGDVDELAHCLVA
ncbi:MAG: UDP-N-acetylmuramate--alanine ligase [Solirubrobacteraceae bacterium]|jgi:UDP-N-acetylmuramate--alanine ligase|nr:UDP-N-acetylmuramate--alanine ligase [Solirubrobacteraceae bacterium]